MRVKSIQDARDRLGKRAADQIEKALQADNKKIIASRTRNKYGNVKTERHGMEFDSILEADVYDDLCRQYGKDSVICQVSVPLAKGKRIRPDFMVIHSRNNDGSFVASFIDAKGRETAEWTAKANHFEDKYGIEILIRRK